MSDTARTLGARDVLPLEGTRLSTSTDTAAVEARRSLVDSGSDCFAPEKMCAACSTSADGQCNASACSEKVSIASVSVAQGALVSMKMALESPEDEILVLMTMASESDRQGTSLPAHSRFALFSAAGTSCQPTRGAVGGTESGSSAPGRHTRDARDTNSLTRGKEEGRKHKKRRKEVETVVRKERTSKDSTLPQVQVVGTQLYAALCVACVARVVTNSWCVEVPLQRAHRLFWSTSQRDLKPRCWPRRPRVKEL